MLTLTYWFTTYVWYRMGTIAYLFECYVSHELSCRVDIVPVAPAPVAPTPAHAHAHAHAPTTVTALELCGRFRVADIVTVLRRYVRLYVKCPGCGSWHTHIEPIPVAAAIVGHTDDGRRINYDAWSTIPTNMMIHETVHGSGNGNGNGSSANQQSGRKYMGVQLMCYDCHHRVQRASIPERYIGTGTARQLAACRRLRTCDEYEYDAVVTTNE